MTANASASMPGHIVRWVEREPAYLGVLLVAIAYLGTLLMLPLDGFWILDQGGKFVQMQAAIRNNYGSVAVPWPGLGLDPKVDFNPMPFPFSVVQDGKLYSIFCPVFAIVSSVPYRLFGIPGLYVLPALCGLGSLLGLIPLGKWLGVDPQFRLAAVLAAGLATPVWFYSAVFWEHTPAVCLTVWALVFCLRYTESGRTGQLAAGAALASLAIYLRDEQYLLLPVLLGAALYLTEPGRRARAFVVFGVTAAAALVPLCEINQHYTGHPTGFHAVEQLRGAANVAQHLADRWEVALRMFILLFHVPGPPGSLPISSSLAEVGVSLLLALPYLALAFLRPRLPARTFAWAVPAAALIAAVSFTVTMAGYFAAWGPLAHMLRANTLFGQAPLLILAFLALRDGRTSDRRHRVLLGLMLAYVLLFWLALPKSVSAPLNWGNRYLLVLYPLMALLAFSTLQEWAGSPSQVGHSPQGWGARGARSAWAVVLAAAASFGGQLFSLDVLARTARFTKRMNDRVEMAPEQVVVTNTGSVPLDLYRVFYSKPIFLIHNVEGFREIKARLLRAGVGRVLLVERIALYPQDPPPGVRYEVIGDEGLKLRAVRVVELALQ